MLIILNIIRLLIIPLLKINLFITTFYYHIAYFCYTRLVSIRHLCKIYLMFEENCGNM